MYHGYEGCGFNFWCCGCFKVHALFGSAIAWDLNQKVMGKHADFVVVANGCVHSWWA